MILFAFMEEGCQSVRRIRKLCRTDIRFLWLLDKEEAPSHMTICNFINHQLKRKIEELFLEINRYIIQDTGVLDQLLTAKDADEILNIIKEKENSL